MCQSSSDWAVMCELCDGEGCAYCGMEGSICRFCERPVSICDQQCPGAYDMTCILDERPDTLSSH